MKCNYSDIWEISGRHRLGMDSAASPCKGPWNWSVLEMRPACSDSSAISEPLTELQISSICCVPGTALWHDAALLFLSPHFCASPFPTFPAVFVPESEFTGLKLLLSGLTSFPCLKREIKQYMFSFSMWNFPLTT